jgi:hypothetical protein
MTFRQPPLVAGRLLKRLVPAQEHDALLGDLCEEYQRGRSFAWYCFQILVAIVVRSWKDVRAHPLVAARATVTGLVAQAFLVAAFPTLLNVLTGGGFMWGSRWIGLPWYWHWPYATSLDTVMMAAWIAGQAMIGWLIVRLHRGHGVPMVLVFCGVLGALHTAGIVQFAHATGRPADLGTLLYVAVRGEICTGALIIAGGYAATRPPEAA